MLATPLVVLLLPAVHGLLDVASIIVQQLHHAKSHICESGSPELVYYENNLTQPLEHVLHLYLQSSAESKKVTTNIDSFLWVLAYATCPLLFIEDGSFAHEFVRITRRRKLIVTSAEFFETMIAYFIEEKIYDTVFLVIDQSQLIVYHYDEFYRRLNKWEKLDSNPLIEASRDMNGSPFLAAPNTDMESIFIDFVVSVINATLGPQIVEVGLLFTNQGGIYGELYNHMYMHHTAGLGALVPKLDMQIPMIYVLLDPYDIETWTAYGLMMLAFAFLRMCYSRRFNLRQFTQSVQTIVACLVLNSSITFHGSMEQLSIGIFKLLSVVLMTAYESLVISFLLNSRFYPELDTIEQLNESCCWLWSFPMQALNFRHYDDCLSALWDETYVPSMQDSGRFECYMFNGGLEGGLKNLEVHRGVIEHYRWSKVQVLPHPVMAVAFGGIGMAQRMSFFASVFLAEGALYRRFVGHEGSSDKGHTIRKPVMVEDLKFLWVVYCCAVGISFVVFVGELMFHRLGVARRKRRILYLKTGLEKNETH